MKLKLILPAIALLVMSIPAFAQTTPFQYVSNPPSASSGYYFVGDLPQDTGLTLGMVFTTGGTLPPTMYLSYFSNNLFFNPAIALTQIEDANHAYHYIFDSVRPTYDPSTQSIVNVPVSGELFGDITPHHYCVRSGRGQHCATNYYFFGTFTQTQ